MASDTETSPSRFGRYRGPVEIAFLPAVAALALVVAILQCSTSSAERDELRDQIVLQKDQIERLRERIRQEEESISEFRRRTDLQQAAIHIERERIALLEEEVAGLHEQTRAVQELRRLKLSDPSFSFGAVPTAERRSRSSIEFEIHNHGGFIYDQDWEELNSLILILGSWETPDRRRCLGTAVSVPLRRGLWDWRLEGGSASGELLLRASADSWPQFADLRPFLRQAGGGDRCLGLSWETVVKVEYKTHANRNSTERDALYLKVRPSETEVSEVLIERIAAHDWERELANWDSMANSGRVVVAANPHHLLDFASVLEREIVQ